MLSASSFNQTPNQGLRLLSNTLSDNPMNEYSSQIGYHDNYIPKPEMYNQFYNQTSHFMQSLNQDSKMYSISEVDSLHHHQQQQHSNCNNNPISSDFSQLDSHNNNKDFDYIISSRLQAMNIKPNCNISRSNSAHNSPYDNRVTPRHFSQSTSNTPLPVANRLGREMDMMRLNAAPIMQLFPQQSQQQIQSQQQLQSLQQSNSPALSNAANSYSIINRHSPVELIEYQSMASKMGFLVGQDLDEVLNRSATMKNSNSSRISNFFKHKHGSSGGSHLTQKQYLVLGVRVPSKEHVSEIVGKEGKKIKTIRQTTGALIATPNEKEDHVFLIEAVPETAIKVGQIIQQLADQITRNKLGNIAGLMGERPRSPPMLGNRTPLATATIGVPQRLVGKVIGTQGSIITTVQKETGTEIKSPPKDELRAPGDTADFEISVYENGTVNSEETAWLQIHRAKQLIAHLVMRVWDQQPRNSTPSSDEGNCTTPNNNNSCSPEWIWPEVSRMDDGDAKEIIDRILRSSKAKITPSTSSAEGTQIDGIAMPPPSTTGTGMSPQFSMSSNLHDNGKQQSSSPGFHSLNSTPFKMLSEDNWNRNSISDCYPSSSSLSSDAQVRNRLNGYKDTPAFYPPPPQYSSMQPSMSATESHHRAAAVVSSNHYYHSNDSAFYDSYYPSVYSPPSNRDSNQQLYLSDTGYMLDHISGESPPPLLPTNGGNHHLGNGSVSHNNNNNNSSSSDSWTASKQVFYSGNGNGNGGNCCNQNYADDTRFGNVKYLWKNCPSESSPEPVGSWAAAAAKQLDSNSSIDTKQQQVSSVIATATGVLLRQNNRVIAPPPESMFGTIGDGRKRNSAASNSDEREDL